MKVGGKRKPWTRSRQIRIRVARQRAAENTPRHTPHLTDNVCLPLEAVYLEEPTPHCPDIQNANPGSRRVTVR